jgi:hypothetical protein
MATAFFVLVALLVCIGYGVYRHSLRGRAAAHQTQLVEDAFAEQLRKHPQLAAARLVRQKDEVVGEGSVGVLTDRIYQGVDGSWWLFICQSGEPGYLTQLNPERAKNALRSTPKILAQAFPEA